MVQIGAPLGNPLWGSLAGGAARVSVQVSVQHAPTPPATNPWVATGRWVEQHLPFPDGLPGFEPCPTLPGRLNCPPLTTGSRSSRKPLVTGRESLPCSGHSQRGAGGEP